MSLNSDMNLRRDIFQALADPKRRSILVLLAAQSMTAGAIANEIEGARSTISKHIQILNECGLVDAKPEGREIHYHLNPLGMKPVAEFIEPFRQLWEDRFNKLEEIMKKHTP